MLTAPLAAAQNWNLDAYAGQVNYKNLDPTVVSSSAAAAIRYNRNSREFQAAAALPLTSKDMTWAAVGAGDRFTYHRRGFGAGVTAFASAHIQRDPILETIGSGFLVEGLPTVSQATDSHLFEVRSGPRLYRGSIGDVSWTRTLWTTEVRAASVASKRLFVEGQARHDRNRGESYTRLGFRAAATLKRIDLEAALGHWVGGVAEAKPEWDLSVTVPMSDRLSIFTTARYENFNPQFLGAPRTSWAAGMTLRIGGTPTPIFSEAVEVLSDRRVVVRIPMSESSATVYIAGDFNGWMPAAMERQGNDWVIQLKVSPGVYKFAFRAGASQWFVPKSIPSRTDDGMGGWVATLVVP